MLQPKVIIEPLIFENTNLEDYKIFCHNGVPKIIQVDIDRYLSHTRLYFDAYWRSLDFSIIYPKSKKLMAKPNNLEAMLDIASKLSEAFTTIRIDLYSNGTEVFVGEITNCSESANSIFLPKAAELDFSNILFGKKTNAPHLVAIE